MYDGKTKEVTGQILGRIAVEDGGGNRPDAGCMTNVDGGGGG